jgi:hypothetical protein
MFCVVPLAQSRGQEMGHPDHVGMRGRFPGRNREGMSRNSVPEQLVYREWSTILTFILGSTIIKPVRCNSSLEAVSIFLSQTVAVIGGRDAPRNSESQ